MKRLWCSILATAMCVQGPLAFAQETDRAPEQPAASSQAATEQVAGELKNLDGAPWVDRTVWLLRDVDGQTERRSSTTDADGRFHFDALEAGSYQLQIGAQRRALELPLEDAELRILAPRDIVDQQAEVELADASLLAAQAESGALTIIIIATVTGAIIAVVVVGVIAYNNRDTKVGDRVVVVSSSP